LLLVVQVVVATGQVVAVLEDIELLLVVLL
jgi:hypothetical protein